MSLSPVPSTPVDSVAELLREIGRLKVENYKLRRRIRWLRESRSAWRDRAMRRGL